MFRYEKLYIVTRRDLPPGLQAAQVSHAAFKFSYDHKPLATQWMEESNFLIILSVADESELHQLGKLAESVNLPVSWFFEPDIGDELTAIAIAPSPKTVEITAGLPLALSEYVKGPPEGEAFTFSVARPSEDRIIIDLRGITKGD